MLRLACVWQQRLQFINYWEKTMTNEQAGSGRKDDADKLRWSLIPMGTIHDMIDVLEYGALKYGEDNWKRVPQANQRYYDAAMRHIDAWWSGEKRDQETDASHLAHAMCCIAFLMYLEKQV